MRLKTIYEPKPIKLGKIKLHLIWFDSMGAKSSSLFIETPDIKLLVDPGSAGMQPSYPLSNSDKDKLRRAALYSIIEYSKRADTVFISHYHYDHHTLPHHAPEIYKSKRLWIKDPNQWINYSQWGRSRLFLGQLWGASGGENIEEVFIPAEKVNYETPTEHLPLSMSQDYGDYTSRKHELLKKGEKWFRNMVKVWSKGPWIREFETSENELVFIDNKTFNLGSTEIKFTPPMFHGGEYDRVGWIIAFVLTSNSHKILYASDLQGPIIEDYASWIIKENPDVLILDGATTYLLGYMLNRINLNRIIKNVCSILENTSAELIIYDHHLLRDLRYRERTAKIYETAKSLKKNLITASEWYGEHPLILKIRRMVKKAVSRGRWGTILYSLW